MYSFTDFDNIKNNGFSFKFPENTLLLLKSIATQCNTPFNTTEVIFKQDLKWERMQNLQKTILKPEQNPNEKKINTLLSHINKLSNNNYDNIKKSIFNIIQELIDSEYDLLLIVHKIFDLISVNKFYSTNYSNLYKDLSLKWKEFESIIPDEMNKYKESLTHIETCDPNDYDLFCKITANNEKRRSKTLFIVNLVKNNLIFYDIIQELIDLIMDSLNEFIHQEKKQHIIEELTEYLFILITEGKDYIDLKINLNNIKVFSMIDIKKTKSLNNKSIFKCKDILDKF